MGIEVLVNDAIVSSNHTVCIVGGARVHADTISYVLPLVERFIAADSGADHLLAAGIFPAAVIGDMDSISKSARATFDVVIHHIPEQDTTDFEKTLSRVDAPVVLAMGLTGGRMDHTLAVLNVLARYRDRAVILLDETDLCFVAPEGETRVDAPIGTRMSLMPLADCRVSVQGLRWSFEDQDMHPIGFISSSNEIAGDVVIQAEGPLLVTLPMAHLSSALQAVVRA
ncbi:thiamine diphosphokinase [Yoonia maritima]|uniref:thiamine diphosphokinase n=1 Tax=Yoonia maritima TaxID=1435347 RepID=UPI000D0FB85E|nr:thiamine diphosphokinase [Yoonia maritima]